MTEKYYTVLSNKNNTPFGFGSSAPARSNELLKDTPGPGKYDPTTINSKAESIRGKGLGFTSKARRRLEFVKGNKNPGPAQYEPQITKKTIKKSISEIPKCRRVSCYPDERESSITPGPGSYQLPSLGSKVQTHIFKSKVERNVLSINNKKIPKFDGKTLYIKN